MPARPALHRALRHTDKLARQRRRDRDRDRAKFRRVTELQRERSDATRRDGFLLQQYSEINGQLRGPTSPATPGRAIRDAATRVQRAANETATARMGGDFTHVEPTTGEK